MKDYIHGFSAKEQARLVRQAEVLAPNVFAELDLSGHRSVLELGCGVGAELMLMRRKWPQPHYTGVDVSLVHLEAARELLRDDIAAHEVALLEADAAVLPLEDASVDCVMTIWMLEHVPNPMEILSEALRVLRPGGELILTEVDNDTFGFDPDQPAIQSWWDEFNRIQHQGGGDPVVGRKMESWMENLPVADVECRLFPNVSSRHEPQRRMILLDYLEELLLSGESRLRTVGAVGDAQVAALKAGFAAVRTDASIHFQYLAYQLVATRT